MIMPGLRPECPGAGQNGAPGRLEMLAEALFRISKKRMTRVTISAACSHVRDQAPGATAGLQQALEAVEQFAADPGLHAVGPSMDASRSARVFCAFWRGLGCSHPFGLWLRPAGR